MRGLLLCHMPDNMHSGYPHQYALCGKYVYVHVFQVLKKTGVWANGNNAYKSWVAKGAERTIKLCAPGCRQE